MTENLQVEGLQAQEPPTPGQQNVPSGRSANRATDLTSRQLGVALTWVQRGMGVVPCGRSGKWAKAALVKGFGKDAPTECVKKFFDQVEVERWWRGQHARAHVGLLTGRGAGGGLLVIDLDQSKTNEPLADGKFHGCMHGTDVLEQLAREAGAEWPETYTVLTPSGGMHLYFLMPEGEPIGCATGDGPRAPHLGPMIDVRGLGGYVIAAGSYSPEQGKAYERITPAGMTPQPVPGWLLALLRPVSSSRTSPDENSPKRSSVRQLPTGDRAERYAAVTLERLCEKVSKAPDGERWRTLSGAALRLAELSSTAPRVLAYSVVLEALTDAAAEAGMSGGAERAERAIRTAWQHKAGAA